MMTQEQIRIKQELSKLRTQCVMEQGLTYRDPIVLRITELMDSITTNETLEEISQQIMVRQVLNQIRSHKRIVRVPNV